MPDLNQAPIEENNVWAASDLGDRDSWTRHFTPAMIGDVIQAVRAVGETPCHQITAKSFPLPSMAGFLDDVHEDLENGRAFTVLAGWPVDDFTYRENVAAYCVIAAQIGDIVVQNYEGQSVVDVVDEDVALTATIDILRAIADGFGPERCMLALGYAGWGPGQLDTEILNNGWLNVDADDNLLFGGDLDCKWTQAMDKIGIDPRMLSDDAGHA